MRRLLLTLFTICTFATTWAQSGASTGAKQLIDIKANLVFPHKLNDSVSVLCLVGNFAAQHNGAVITADSAVRFENDRLECFGNVLINKNTTYAYADEALYDGNTNIAALVSPLVKVIDEDVTMYARKFEFNTQSNVGTYWDGGLTLKDGENSDGEATQSVMESERGYYYSDTKEVVGVDRVELSGESYMMRGDSVSYNMDKEVAHFYDNTNIWSDKDNYIYGDRGLYDRDRNLCIVDKNSYLLTAEQEAWCDTMEYYTQNEEAILHSNIQLDDTTNKSMVFGHFAHYWGADERIVLTRNPAIINYDSEGDKVDTLFLRGDTILINSRFVSKEKYAKAEEETVEEEDEEAEFDEDPTIDSLFTEMDSALDSMLVDSTSVDSLIADTLGIDTLQQEAELSPRELRKIERTKRLEERRQEQRIKEHQRLIDRQTTLRERIAERVERGKSIYSDSMVMLRVTSMLHADSVTWGFMVIDSASLDSLAADSSMADAIDSATQVKLAIEPQDSVYRTAIAFGNVRVYRNDVQMACDSMVAQSVDSTMQLYRTPILWSENSQITAQQMNFYTLSGALDYAEFLNNPIMAAEIVDGDSVYYNQITGKTMTAYFEGNEIVQNDVDMNVRTIYFMQDEKSGEVNTIAQIESGDASFYIENQALSGVTYRSSPTYIIAPMDKIPVDVNKRLPDFKWHSDIRPTRENIFDYSIRPSLREVKSSLPRPTFPIKQSIDLERERLIVRDVWQDRSEQVSEEATEWMKSLGFTPGEPRPEGMTF